MGYIKVWTIKTLSDGTKIKVSDNGDVLKIKSFFKCKDKECGQKIEVWEDAFKQGYVECGLCGCAYRRENGRWKKCPVLFAEREE